MYQQTTDESMAIGKTSRSNETKANEDMNHRTKSVVGHMVEGHKSRASYFFRQTLNGVEFLLQRKACISQDLEAAQVKRADEEVECNLQQHVRYK